MGKNIGKNISKNLSSKYCQKLLDRVKKSAQMNLKLLQIESFKKRRKQLVIQLVIKLLIKLQKLQKTHNKIIQRQLQISIIKKYLKKICISKRKTRNY